MTRPRHAMRVHPLRSKGVVVGVPVAAVVAFGAHTVLGITPVSDRQDVPSVGAAGTSPAAGPVQSYGLASTPPPTTLGLLSAHDAHDAPGPSGTSGTAASGAGTSGSSHAGGAQTVPIRSATGTPASMMTFTPAAPHVPAAAPAAAAPAVAAPAAAPVAHAAAAAPQAAARTAAPAPTTSAAENDGGSADDGGSSGGALVGVDLGVAKVSLLSFGG